MRCSYLPYCTIALSLTLAPAHASAEQPPVTRTSAAAIERGNEGVTLFEAGRWNEALARFTEAEGLYHSPVFVLYTARTLRNVGRLREARETYRRLLSETLAPSAPGPWKQAQADARSELSALAATMPSVVFALSGGSPAARLFVDNHPVAAGAPLELDPGSYHVVATDGPRHLTVAFNVATGAQRQPVNIVFPSVTPPELPPRVHHQAHDSHALFVPGLVVAGIGGATLIAGTITGVLALSKKPDARRSLPASCIDGRCPEAQQQAVEEATAPGRHLATATDILLVTGAVISLTGAGLLLFVPGEPPKVSASVSPRGGSVSVSF
jgi:hypothetical protein